MIYTLLGVLVGCLYVKASLALLRVLNCSVLVDGLAHTALQHQLTRARFSFQLTRSERDRTFFLCPKELGSLLDTLALSYLKERGLNPALQELPAAGAAAGPMALATTSILATTA